MEAFAQLTIFLIAIILLARLSSVLSSRLAISAVSIQLLVGILLGPSWLNLLGSPIVVGTWGSPFPSPLHNVLKIFAEIGLIQLMFLAGLEVDWHELKKLFKPSFSTGAWGFVLVAMSVTIVTRTFVDRWTEALAMSAIVSASSFGISIYYLREMKFLGSRVAMMVSGAAIWSGLMAILLMIGSQATNYAMIYGTSRMTIAVSWFLGKLIMFFVIAYFLTSRFLRLVARTGFEKRPRQMLIGYLLLVASLYAWGAMHFGSFAAIGIASMGGALMGISNIGLKERISKGFGSSFASLPMGVLFVVLGMEANLREPGGYINFLVILVSAIVGAKLVGLWITTRRGFGSFRERALIMIGILQQGEMGMLIAAYLFSRGLVNPSSFNAAIIAVIMLMMLVPIAMKVVQIKFNIQLNVVAPFTGGKERDRWQ